MRKIIFILYAFFLYAAYSPAITIYTIGDSTMANKQKPETNKERGWGMLFQSFFDIKEVKVENHALNGRSSKSFLEENRWQPILDKLQPGDYVFIQFGHNDEKINNPKLYTDPDNTYREYLAKYVNETRQKGAYPVLLTSVVRRHFDENGVLLNSHGKYPDAVREVADSLNVPLIDMEKKSRGLIENLGVEDSKKLFMISTGKDDNTHFVEAGALAMGKLAIEGICENELPLSKYIIGQKTTNIIWPEIKKEMKPWTRWWWFGSAVNEKDLTYSLEEYQKAGLGGVEITPIYGVRGTEKQFIEYLSPQWMDMLAYTLNEAKRLDIGVDLANASGWPFGGPWVEDETASKSMVSRTYEVKGGNTIRQTINYTQEPMIRTQGRIRPGINDIKAPITTNENLQEYAFDQVRYKKELPVILVTANKKDGNGFTETINLTDRVKNGILEWKAPEGEWIICALFQGDHGKTVERAGPGGEGYVIDHFSSEALKKYLDKFDNAFKGYDLSYLRHYFNDSYEVDDAVGESNWTPKFFVEFEKINGYDLRKYIPALLGKDTKEMNSRVIYDYRVAIGQLLLDRYTKGWQAWAAKQGKGIRNQSHGSPANVLDLYAASDIPEIEGNDIVNLKSASSAAHVTGKNLVSSESVTWLNEHFRSSLGDVKTAIDKFFLAGINHVFYHGTSYSPQDAKWPGWLFYASVHFTPVNSFWDDFGTLNQYIARTQSFLQAGKPSNDILVYFSIADYWSVREKTMLHPFHSDKFFNETPLKECGDYLTKNGYSWDAISDKQLLDVSYNNSLLYAGGNAYKTILIPETHHMPIETFWKLMNLAQNGATIIFYKGLPTDVPGLANVKENQKKMNVLKEKLSFTKSNAVSVADYGKGRIIVSDNVAELLDNSQIVSESMYDAGLQCIRRVKDDGNFYYYILNPTSKEYKGWICLNGDYTSAALYNPMSGVNGYAEIRENSEKMEVYIHFKPNEAFIVETYKDKYSGELYPFYEQKGEAVAITDNWQIEFVKGGPTLPPTKTVETLESWTNYGTEYAVFSGTAVYTTRIPALAGKSDAWLLDLGKVNESAAVYLNDEYLGTIINSPYTIEIPSDKLKGDDKLSIKVSNLMANRIADMDKKDIEWRIFYNTNFAARRKENTGEDGKFSAKKWAPIHSGLSGPVALKPLEKFR